MLSNAGTVVLSLHGRLEHFAAFDVELFAAILLFHVALDSLYGGAFPEVILKRMLYVYQKREVRQLCCRSRSFGNR